MIAVVVMFTRNSDYIQIPVIILHIYTRKSRSVRTDKSSEYDMYLHISCSRMVICLNISLFNI